MLPGRPPLHASVVIDYQNIHLTAHDVFAEPGAQRHTSLIDPPEEHDPQQYRRNLAQQAQWTRDKRVHVHLRPLTYRFERDATGRPLLDVLGRKKIIEVREKGVDVLVALCLVREAVDPDLGLVILASHDTDLAPAIDEALDLGRSKIETCSWWNPERRRVGAPQPSGERRVWNTRLRVAEFERSQDRTGYS